RWATERMQSGHLPFDGWFPQLSLGLPQFHHYQSLPHSIAGFFGLAIGPENAVMWFLYLGVSLWPLSVYVGVRLFDLDRRTAIAAALMAPLLNSASSYGWEHGSYTWRGLGVWSQIWGMWLMPIAVPLGWRAVQRGKRYALASGTLGLTFATHFLTGYVTMLSLGLWTLIKPREFVSRAKRAALIGIGAILTISWVVVPLLSDTKFSNQTAFNRGVFWNDSYGARKILWWLFRGEVFDYGHFPTISIFVAIGTALCVARFRSDERARAVLSFSLFNLVLWFGRATFGDLTKILPGGDDLIMHRFISGVHTGGLILAGIGAVYAGQLLLRTLQWGGIALREVSVRRALPALLVVSLVPGALFIVDYDKRGAELIHEQRRTDSGEGAKVGRLIEQANKAGDGRIYAGMPSNWARNEYRLYGVPLYIETLNQKADGVGFTLRVQSLMSDVEAYFDETNAAHYDLFNVRYALLPVERPAPPNATVVDSTEHYRLYRVPTTGYFDLVDTVAPPLITDRRNMNLSPAEFLKDPDLALARLRQVAFDGEPAPLPTSVDGRVRGRPGTVQTTLAKPKEGEFAATVRATRTSIALLKATYHPRWRVTVDGREAKAEMIAPALVGVRVPPGQHTVEFSYRSFRWFLPLWLLGALTLVALARGPRLLDEGRLPLGRGRRRSRL
ncbi:MAG: YfhO family protein, partial [Acidimicrobiales bacterium]|nr:YfhO family protein [Acidimicrobiales bacterium]